MNAYHSVDNLRLEVASTPGLLPNMVQNPSGTLGAWGYLTPVANTNMTSTGTYLHFTTTVTQAAHFTTELMPVAAGRYVGARFDAVGASTGYRVKGRFVFYDAAKVLLSSGPQSADFLGTPQTNYIASALAPASTAYVALRFDFYNSGGGNPAATGYYRLTRVMVTNAATSADIATSRTNLATNPSFETNTTGWAAGTFGTIARVTTLAQTGAACLRITQSVAAQIMTALHASLPVAGGGTYTASAWFRAATVARDTYITIGWRNAANTALGSATAVRGTDSTGAWTQLVVTGTAPAGATKAEVIVGIGKPGASNPAAGEQHYVDALLLEETAVFRPYFDGATAAGGGKAYAWTGTAHGSKSTETATASYDFIEPTSWRNILGPTHAMSIERGPELDVGSTTFTILDELLDPAASDELASDKGIRLQSLIAGVWENVYEGTIDDSDAVYELQPDGTSRTRITVKSTDAVAELANQGEARGVATIAQLPFILEGKGVPWNVNGSGNQVAAAAIVSTSEGASVVDQIALTRDSVSGYAWVDRYNVLTAYDRDLMPSLDMAVNPGAEVDAAGWQGIGGTVARSTVQAHAGAASIALTTTATGDPIVASPPASFAVTPGSSYSVSLWTRAATVARNVTLRAYWYDEDGINFTSSIIGIIASSTSAWVQAANLGAFVAPAGSRQVLIGGTVAASVAGEVNYFDDLQIFGGPAYIFSDEPNADPDYNSFTDIQTSSGTSEIINEVSVLWLRPNPATGETEEIPYGPYRDPADPIPAKPRRATFRIHGTTESATIIEDFALAVIDLNKNPIRRVKSLTMPVKDERSLTLATRIDLYTLVGVELQDLVAASYRVTSIKHTIDPAGWQVTYGFAVDGQVASPGATPSPVGTDPVDGVWQALTLINGWVNIGGGYAPASFMRKNGIVYLKGWISSGTNVIIGALAAGYRPLERRRFAADSQVVSGAASAGTAHTHIVNGTGSVHVLANGQVAAQQYTPAYGVALDGVFFPAEA